MCTNYINFLAASNEDLIGYGINFILSFFLLFPVLPNFNSLNENEHQEYATKIQVDLA